MSLFVFAKLILPYPGTTLYYHALPQTLIVWQRHFTLTSRRLFLRLPSFYQRSANHVSFCFCETYSTLSWYYLVLPCTSSDSYSLAETFYPDKSPTVFTLTILPDPSITIVPLPPGAIKAPFSTGPNGASSKFAFLCLLLLDKCMLQNQDDVFTLSDSARGSGKQLNHKIKCFSNK